MLRILLDECLPVRFRFLLPGQHVETVRYRGWLGKKNGDLLSTAQVDFDALVTVDKNIPDQQYLSQFDLALIVIRVKDPKPAAIEAQFRRIPEILDQVTPGKVLVISTK